MGTKKRYSERYYFFPKCVYNICVGTLLMCFAWGSTAFELKAQNNFQFEKVFYLSYKGDWNYPIVNPHSNKLYITQGNQVTVLNKFTGDSIGIIPNTPGVKSVALATRFGKGYTANTISNTITVFDLKSDRFVKEISLGVNPTIIIYDEYASKIISSNAKDGTIIIIDPRLDRIETTLSLKGNKITGMTSDGNGNLFINLADKREVVWLNMSTYEVMMHWSLGPGKLPTGLAVDSKNKRLFSVCNKLLVVFDVSDAKIIDTLSIGMNSNGIVYNPASRFIFVANGDGTVSVINQLTPNEYKFIQNIPTKKGANLIAFDELTHTLFVQGAEQQILSKAATKQLIPINSKTTSTGFQVIVPEKL